MMKTTVARRSYTFKMNFRADPGTDHQYLRNDLKDMISTYPGQNKLKGNKLVVEDAGAALIVKLRYFNNIVSIQ